MQIIVRDKAVVVGGRVFMRSYLLCTLLSAGALALVGCEPSSRSAPADGQAARKQAPSSDRGANETDASQATAERDGAGGKGDRVDGPCLFSDATTASSLDFVHQVSGDDLPYFMPKSVGSGAAIFDCNGDGRLDVYLLQNGGEGSGASNRLFVQELDGTFRDVSVGSGVDIDGFGMGSAAGDVNNDGRVDLLVTEYGNARLFLNKTDGGEPKFVDVSAEAGVSSLLWGTSTCFTDYDRDGLLDIVLVNYVNYDPSRWCADGRGQRDFCGPDAFRGRTTNLFHNLGPNVDGIPEFEDVSIEAGLTRYPGPGLGVFCADFDGDRWPDIFIANDGKPNHLWINGHDGTFQEEAAIRGIGYNSMGKTEADMGVAIGDVNGDGKFDLFITHLTSETHTLWLQQKRGTFLDRTAESGLTKSAWRGTGFGTAMADFDNDGRVDLAIANGRVVRQTTSDAPTTSDDLDPFWRPYSERNQLFLNVGGGRFEDVSPANDPFCKVAAVSRGLAVADFDTDGGVDLLVTRIGERVGLFKNVAPSRGHYLIVKATDPTLKRDAYGAEIYVRSGDRQWMRWINPGYSFLCSNDPRAHFGLGTVATYDSIRVVWPNGQAETFPGGEVDCVVHLERGTGVPTE